MSGSEDVPVPLALTAAGAAAVAAPVPMLAGTFAVYEDGEGGFVLVTDTGDGPGRKHIPAGLVKLVGKAGILGRVFG